MAAASAPRHFSMLRGFRLADFFTLGNAACGVGAVLLAMVYLTSGAMRHFWWAAAMAPAALVFDILDGRIARWRRQHSELGRELDSLADVISFGVAPVALGFAAGMNGGWDAVVLIYFVCCGVSRLARFNITGGNIHSIALNAAFNAARTGMPVNSAVVLAAVRTEFRKLDKPINEADFRV